MPICRTGVHEAYTTVADRYLARVPTSAMRLYYQPGGPDWSAKAHHAAAVQDAGIYGWPQLHQTGKTDVDGYVETVEEFLTTQPHFDAVELGNEPWRNAEYDEKAVPPFWPMYREQFAATAPLVREAGSKAILAAARAIGTDREDFLSEFDRWDLVDGVAIHPYAKTPFAVVDMASKLRALIPREKPLYITEVGWASTGGRSEAMQASMLKQVYQLLLDPGRLADLNLRLIVWFCYHDGGEDAQPYFRYTGLLRENGSAKPAFHTMAAIRKATKFQLQS